MWLSMVNDGHDIFCGCTQPFAHLLDQIFPEGHTDRHHSIDEIIQRDLKCLSGGEDETNLGIPLGGTAASENIKQEEPTEEEENIDALLAAAAAAAEDTR